MPAKKTDLAKLASAIDHLAEVHDRRLGEINDALEDLAFNTKQLGNGNAATQMGGLEGLGKSVLDGLSNLSDSISSASERIAEANQKAPE